MSLTNVNNIALVRRNGLGDMICAMPLLLYLREKAPQASITLFCDKSNAAILPLLPKADEVVVFPSGNKYLSVLSSAYLHRSKNFDLAISAKTSPMKLINFFLYFLGAQQRIATVDNSWHRSLINNPVPYSDSKARILHQSLKTLQLLDPSLKEVPKHLYPSIKIPSSVLKNKEKIVCQKLSPLSTNVPLILISVSYNRASSNPGIEFYKNILNRLHRVHPVRIAISCLAQDLEIAKKLSKQLFAPSVAISSDDIETFVTLLDLSDLIFIGDGGIMHIAAAMGKPQVTLFGETLLEEWQPLSEKATCFHHPENASEISREQVLKALLQQLDSISSQI
ncbi:MAG: ADP-heptose:LPS heptosyltransferase [Chlamydiales bacterium]|jgi:ADP-heptose:LPS heptosyltransferase